MSEEHRIRDEELGIVPMSVEFRDALVADLRRWCDALTPKDARPQVEPDLHALVRELRAAVGLFDGAMPVTPQEAWEEAINEVRKRARDD